MRSRSIVLVAIAVLVSACGGGSGGSSRLAPTDQACEGASCSPEGPEAKPSPEAEPPVAPLRCDAANACPEGYRCVDDTPDNCDPATGMECDGVCILGEELPGCGGTQEPCPPGTVCVDDPNDACEGGPAVDCLSRCQPEATGNCETDADCPALPAVCNVCADGSASCPTSRCDAAGKCTIDAPPCSEPLKCGGITGLACPEGFQCAYDPTTNCNPERGDADCSGICVPGQDPLRCGGIAGVTCPPGFTCTDDPDNACDDHEGADCGGVCVPETPDECNSDADCPLLRAPCEVCADGNEVCPKSWCAAGRCSVSFPSCGSTVVCGDDGSGCPPGQLCVPDPAEPCDLNGGATPCKGQCAIIDLPRPCEDGGTTCPPGYECTTPDGSICDPNAAGEGCTGVCVPSKPQQCSTDNECPQAPGPCLPCQDGTVSCSHAECRNGECAVVLEACTGSDFCGGIAGFPCPPGLTCVDNPNDDCDPLRGGADCAGMCVREERPAECGGFTGASCPPGYECVDEPNDDCGPATGGADCPGICQPAPSPSCDSDEECDIAIGAPCRICPDGTAACPKASCVNGACQVDFGGCGF